MLGEARRRQVQDVAGEAPNNNGSDTCGASVAIVVDKYQVMYM